MQYLSPFAQQTREENEKSSIGKRVMRFLQRIGHSLSGIGQAVRLVWATNPWLTLLLGAATFFQAVLPAISIYINKLLIDAIVDAIGHTERVNHDLSIIIFLGIMQFAISGGASLFATLTGMCRQLLQTATANRIEYMIMEHANALDQSFFEQSTFYDALRNAQREATMRPVMMITGLFDLFRDIFTFASMIVLLVRLQWLLAPIILTASIPAFISNTKYGWQSFQLMQEQSLARRIMLYLSMLLTTDTYRKEIRVFQLGNFFLERFKTLSTQILHEDRSLYTKRSLIGFFWGLLTLLVSSGTFLYVALLALYSRITLGDVTLYAQAANAAQTSFQNLLASFSTMYENNLYMSILFDVLASTPQIRSPQHPAPLQEPFKQGIEFQHVTFSYAGSEKPSLHNVSFTLDPGETLAIVGSNGAGKTTLIKLLARLYDPQVGEIRINGRNIREYSLEDLHAKMGIIFQDYISYQLTAQENIGVGNLQLLNDIASIEEAARKSGADTIIAKLPDSYSTMLGRWFEQGHQLSGGEWQKIALARAFIRDAQILILDEPTASLDAQAEYELFQHIRDLTRGRTTIFISHRFSTVRLADRILVIEQGEVVEQGRHEELLAQGGRYAELFNLQAESYR